MEFEVKGLAGVGRMSEDEAKALLKRIPKAGNVLEIGTYHGVTCAMLARNRPWVRFVCLDTFVMPTSSEKKWEQNKTSNMYLYPCDSLEYYGSSDKPFDVIIIDGGHDIPSCSIDLGVAEKLLAKDGIVICHDYTPKNRGVKVSVDSFVKAGRFKMVETYKRSCVLKK